MKIIEYKKLYKYLQENDGIQGKDNRDTLRVIFEIRKLPKEYKQAILDIIDNRPPCLSEIEDISYNDLIEKYNMRPIRAVLMLDWIRREPDEAIQYLYESFHRASLSINDEVIDEAEKAIKRLEEKGVAVPPSPPIDHTEDNIPVDDNPKAQIE